MDINVSSLLPVYLYKQKRCLPQRTCLLMTHHYLEGVISVISYHQILLGKVKFVQILRFNTIN